MSTFTRSLFHPPSFFAFSRLGFMFISPQHNCSQHQCFPQKGCVPGVSHTYSFYSAWLNCTCGKHNLSLANCSCLQYFHHTFSKSVSISDARLQRVTKSLPQGGKQIGAPVSVSHYTSPVRPCTPCTLLSQAKKLQQPQLLPRGPRHRSVKLTHKSCWAERRLRGSGWMARLCHVMSADEWQRALRTGNRGKWVWCRSPSQKFDARISKK